MTLLRRTFLLAALALLFLLTPSAPTRAQAITPMQRAALEAQLAQVQSEEAQAQSALSTAESKSSSLKNAIATIQARIKVEELDITAKRLLLQTLGQNISSRQAEIVADTAAIAQNQQAISSMFRQMQQSDAVPLVVVLFQNQTLSGFFKDAVALSSLQQDISVLSQQLAAAQASSTAAKTVLVSKQNATNDAVYALQQEQKKLDQSKAEQQKLLSISKNNEASYTTLVNQKKRQIAAINAKLFALAGGSNPIPFGNAYQYALAAQKSTGVDPSFLLAIMTQESNLGYNQGNCYLTNENTGAGVSVKTGVAFSKVMSPADIPNFLKITSALYIDPLHTVVSCPQQIGWGGAMGPAQFIPNTWMLFNKRVGQALGNTGMSNPWDPQQAFVASALFLSDLGASGGGYTAERNAACRYFSGSSCGISSFVASYGNSVMALASKIQSTEINPLQGTL